MSDSRASPTENLPPRFSPPANFTLILRGRCTSEGQLTLRLIDVSSGREVAVGEVEALPEAVREVLRL